MENGNIKKEKGGELNMGLGYENPSFLYRMIDELGNNRLFGAMYRNYIKTLQFGENERVLDFGSGSGAGSKHLAKALQKLHGHLTCIDISEYWTNKAKKRMKHYDNVDFLIGQLPELGLDDNSFDTIYIFFALHDVSEDLREKIVGEFFRALKSDGKLFIKEPQRENDGMPSEEIAGLMQRNGFYAEITEEHKGMYRAVYRKTRS